MWWQKAVRPPCSERLRDRKSPENPGKWRTNPRFSEPRPIG